MVISQIDRIDSGPVGMEAAFTKKRPFIWKRVKSAIHIWYEN